MPVPGGHATSNSECQCPCQCEHAWVGESRWASRGGRVRAVNSALRGAPGPVADPTPARRAPGSRPISRLRGPCVVEGRRGRGREGGDTSRRR